MQISFIESLLQLYKIWTDKENGLFTKPRQKLFMESMRQACSAGWKASDQSEDAHHADVSTEEELAGCKRKLRF